MGLTASGLGIASPTIGQNAYAMYTYVSTGAGLCLDIGFIPQYCRFVSASNTWEWHSNMSFGQATTDGATLVSTGGVLDTINGSGQATTNIATTTRAVGLVVGTNIVVNNGGLLTYTGFALR